MDTPCSLERHFDTLVLALRDAIDHAQTLQRQADFAVEKSISASSDVTNATNALTRAAAGLDGRLAAQIVEAVAKPFDSAVDQAAGMILADMDSVKTAANKAITDLKAECESTMQAIDERSNALERRLWRHNLPPFAAGILVAVLVDVVTHWFG